jgi:plastocyanin
MHKRVYGLSGLALLALLSACGGGGDTTAPPGPLAVVSVGGPSGTLAVGGTLQLTVAGKDANGTTLTGLAAATWTSSNTAVATVGATTGLVTGVAVGSATITATISGIAGTKAVAVAQPTATATVAATTGLTFEPAQVDILAGGTVTWQFQATAHNVTFNSSGSPTNIGDTANGNVGRTFPTAGTFAYHCTLHPGMNGTVIVH